MSAALLESVHNVLARVVGDMAISIVRRKTRKSTLRTWANTLKELATKLERLADG